MDGGSHVCSLVVTFTGETHTAHRLEEFPAGGAVLAYGYDYSNVILELSSGIATR